MNKEGVAMNATAPGSHEHSQQKEVTVEDHRIEALMTYTAFHIGLYLTMIAALMAAERGFALFEGSWIVVLFAIVLLTVAGICGGIIAVNVAEFDPNMYPISYFFTAPTEKNGGSGYRFRLWGKARMGLWYELVARIEHGCFWLAVILLVGAFSIHLVRQHIEKSAEKPAAASVVDQSTHATYIEQHENSVPALPNRCIPNKAGMVKKPHAQGRCAKPLS